MQNSEVLQLAAKLKAAKDKKKELEAEVKAVNAEIEQLDAELSDKMTESELEKFSYAGNTFYLSSRLFASPAGGRKAELYEALKSNGYGEIVTETVNANTLASFVKERMAEGEGELPAWLADVVSTYEKVSVGVRKG